MSQNLSSSQLRAARALLNWSRAELAKHTGISELTIHRIENDLNKPEERTRQKLRMVLEQHGIEFLESDGTRRQPEGVEIFQGDEDFRKLYDFIYAQASLHGGSICVSGVDESLFIKHEQTFIDIHTERMSALMKKRNDIRMLILIREGDTNFVASKYASYRWQNPESFSPTAFYVFGNYLALISFQAEVSPKVILIHSAEFAEAYRRQFMDAWKRAVIPKKKNIA